MTTSPPDRSTAQRLSALERANLIRTYRAELKRDVKAGRVTFAQAMDRGELVASMKLYDLLVAMPKVGRVKANKVLTTARISPSKTIGGLSQRQRGELRFAIARSAPAASTYTDRRLAANAA
jgi:hypothetical protein